jgi:hypothetical protein
MTANINPFSGQTYEIAADLSEPLIIENFDPTKDAIQLPTNAITDTKLPTLPHLRFNNEYRLTVKDGDTFITDVYGKLLAVVKETVELKPFTGYTPEGKFTLVSLDNEFFADNIASTFFEPWYLEYDASDYGNSVQKAIDAGLVDSAYEHYLNIGQYEAREDSLFVADSEGNNTLYGTGYETGLVGVPISEGLYTRDVNPLSTGRGEVDTLVGGTGEDTFFLGNGTVFQDKPQAFYVGGGDEDYALIENFSIDTIYGFPYVDGDEEFVEELTDRIIIGGKPYDYDFEKVDGTTRISTKEGDLVAIIAKEVTLDASWQYFPGTSYLYPVDSMTSLAVDIVNGVFAGGVSSFYEPFYLAEKPEVAEAVENGEYESALEHYVKVGQFDAETEVILNGTAGDDAIESFSGMGQGAAELLFGVPLTFVDGEKEGWTTATTGVGEQDYLQGGMGVTTYFIGNDNILDSSKGSEVYYVGEGDEDFVEISSFDPYKDFIFAAGNPEDYTVERVEGTVDDFDLSLPIQNFEISYKGDLVAIVRNVGGSLYLDDNWMLQEFSFGEERPNGFAFVAPVNEFLPPETISPFTGETFVIDADAAEILTIENFDPTKDSIQLPANPDSEVIPQFSFSDRYILTEINGDTAISTLTGQLLAVVKGVTGLKTFTGYTEKGTYSLVSLENEFFSTYLEPNFFEPWYVEFDASDYGNSVQKAIDAGLVNSAYEHYLKFGQFEAREDGLFAPTTDGNNTLYGSGYENGLVGVPISEGFYTRDVKPITTGVGEIDTLIGAPGEDTFFLGNVAMLNETAQPFYVGEGDSDYVLIKGFGEGSTYGAIFAETGFPEFSGREALTDRILLAGKPYDYEFERVGEDIKIFFQDDLIAIIEDLPSLDQHFYIPGGTYVYTTGNVATFQGWGSENTLYEPFYFEENPGVEEAIANGEYESALDHLVKVGQFNPEGEVIFSGSSGDDAVVGLGAASLLFGVEVTFVDGEKEGYRTATTGVGEADFAVGSFGIDTFFIGNDNILDPEKGGEVWYVGNGDEDFLTIQGFDPYKDFLFGAGDFADYSFEVVEDSTDGYPFKSLEVNYQGDRVALIKYIDGSLTLPDLTSLIAFPLGEERPNGLALVASQNEFLPPDLPGLENFNGDFYLALNPDVIELVGEGKPYATALDYYIEVGQFREDGGGHGFFDGSSSNDILQGFGFDKDLFGVKYTNVEGTIFEGITLELETTGIGEIDILVGSEGIDGFYGGAYTSAYLNLETGEFDVTATPLYVGEGDNDYVLIKDFDLTKDYFALAGDITDYEYEVVGGNFKVYKEGDLVAIVENAANLQPNFIEPGVEIFNFSAYNSFGFDEDLYLQFTPDAAAAVAQGAFDSGLDYYVAVGQYASEGEGFFTGTDGNDYIIGFGQATGLSGVGMKARTDIDPFAIEFESTGEGEVDTLVGNQGTNGFLLGSFVTPASPEQFVFYQGNGDEDYALIRNFNPGEVGGDELEMVGNPDDYTFENVDGNVEIAYKGDLVAIVENISDLQVTGTFVDGEASYFTVGKYPVEQFNAEVYGAFNPDIFEFIGEGKPYKDVLDYYIQEGQFREDGGGHGFFSGSSGNDVLQGFGFDKDLFGVAYTSVTGSVPDEIILVPETLGVGEIDTMIGSPGIDGFYAAAFTKVDFANFSGEAEALYVGEGDGDYVLIKGFDPAKDYFALAGAPADYIYKVESNDFKVYTSEGDLVAIVEDTTDLKVENIFDTFNLFTFEGDDSGQGLGFDEEAYLGIYPEVAQLVADGQYSSALEHYIKVGQYEEGGSIYSGTSGNDTAISWTQNAEVRLSGVDFVKAEPAGFEEGQHFFGIKPATYGVGEIDTLILSPDEGTIGEALLGFFRGADGSIQRFYVGQGDADYALVKNFDKNDLDEIFLAGTPTDYTYTDVDGNLHIAYQGDLVGIVEGVKFGELELADEGEGSGAFVLIGNPNSPDVYFNESVYLTLHPKVQELIDNGEYESAYDYYLEVGEDKGHRAFLSGTAEGNDDITAIGDKSTLFGVEVVGFDKENNQFLIEDDGAGEIDNLTGNEGRNRFVLGNDGQSFYVGGGNEDYVNIYDFDPLIDSLILAGDMVDYSYETVAADGVNNLEISTKDGDLVAIIHDIDDKFKLNPLPVIPARFPNDSVIVSSNQDNFARLLEETFYAPIYPIQNPDVDALIEQGLYDSYFDHFIKAGQYEDREDTFFVGTGGNNVLVGLGAESIITGVEVSAVDYGAYLDVKPLTTGEGEVDTYIGGSGFDIFLVGNGWTLNDEPKPFYVGNGDADYALIQNINPDDFDIIRIAGNWDDYQYEVIGEDTHISTLDGDLVAIAEGRDDLVPWFYGGGLTLLVPRELLQAGGDADASAYFREDLYLEQNPDVVTAIEAGEYESGYDHFLKVGIFEDRQVVYQGTAESDDFTPAGNAIEIGVPTSDFNPETLAFTLESFGVGEQDYISASSGDSLIILGSNSVLGGEAKPFYVGNGDEDFIDIYGFDAKHDRLMVAGAYDDYTYELIEEGKYGGQDYNIYTKDGDLVASLSGVPADFELKPYAGYNPAGSTILLSLENEFFNTSVKPYFFEPIYPIQNPDVVELVESGEYESYYDHFLKAGQFEEREDTFFAGTEGNDTLYSIGWENILSGVPITQAQYQDGLDIVPSNLGSGQIDTLYGNGGSGKETIFMLGNGNILNDTAQSFYLGNADEDYALIKNFTAGDRIFLGSDVAGFTQTVVDGNLHIAKDGDLIAIIENRTELTSDRPNELTSLATESYASGTDGDDTVFGSTRQSSIIGVPLANDDMGGVYATTTGAGEFDTLNGSKRGNTFYLGIATTPDGAAQPLYVGNGDEDYALISNFSNTEQYDSVALAGKVSDYNFEFEAYEGTGNDTKIYTKDGDLIGIVENATLSQFYVEGVGITLYSVSTSGTTAEVADYLFDIEPFFYEEFYLDENPEVADLIASGEYGSAFEHFIEVGQFSPESELILSGTVGDDLIPSMGNADLVFGVPLTTVDGTLEGWEEASTGVGEQDTLGGGLGVTTFFIGNDQILDPAKPNEVYYVGKGDADYALIQGFQPTQDFIFGAGSIEEYSFETVDGDLKISYGSDLVAIVDDAGDLTLQAFPLGEERPRALALVAPDNQFLSEMG